MFSRTPELTAEMDAEPAGSHVVSWCPKSPLDASANGSHRDETAAVKGLPGLVHRSSLFDIRICNKNQGVG